MTRVEYAKAKVTFADVNLALREGHLTPEERAQLQALSVKLSERLVSPWFPMNRACRAAVFILVAVGLYGATEGPDVLVWTWPVALFFSPRLTGEA